MKKLGLLISMILMVTIGGVYATWYYASETQKMSDASQNVALGLTGTVNDATYGTYVLNINTGIQMWIDPKDDGAGSHTTALYFGTYADKTLTTALETAVVATVKYTPGDYVPTDVSENGVITTWRMGSTVDLAAWTYKGAQIFTSIETTMFEIHPYGTEGKQCWTRTEVTPGVYEFSYDITVAMVRPLLHLNAIELDTAAKYTDYNTALGTGKVSITVSDGRTIA